MKRLMTVMFAAAVALLAGCATNYDVYAKAQESIVKAQSDAETARLVALARIAEQGDAATRTAAVVALALTGNRGAVTQMQAPSDPALEWARVLVPGLTNITGIVVNAQTARHASDNTVRMQEVNMGAVRDVAVKGIDAAAKDPVIVEPVIVEVPAATP